RPLAPDASLPGTFAQPVFGCHSQTSPFRSPESTFAETPAVGAPDGGRGSKFVAAKPPSGSATTALSPSGSGATTQPIHVTAGGAGPASIVNTSIDSRPPWCTA